VVVARMTTGRRACADRPAAVTGDLIHVLQSANEKQSNARGRALGSLMSRLRVSDVASLLRRRIQWGMHMSLVKPGDRVPSLRAASNEFGVDQRSVLAAYRELEGEGLVVMKPRSGIYVAGDRQGAAALAPSTRWMSEMFLQGFARGVPPVDLANTLSGAVHAKSLTAACLECNADQILWMATQLRHEFGLNTSWIETGLLGTEVMVERLSAADFIVTTAFHSAEARRVGAEYELPVVVVTAGGDRLAQMRAQLSRGPIYFVGTDERYVKKLLEGSDSTRWMANLRPLVLDQLTPRSIPTDAPMLATRAAADILGTELPRNAIVMDYPFSTESRAEVIALMLAAHVDSARREQHAATR
jgi:DNA-binding transcriptional regulator YhcF (GntR family)